MLNQAEIGVLNFNQVNTGSQTSSYANEQGKIFSANLQSENSKVTLKYFANSIDNSVDDNAIAGWILSN